MLSITKINSTKNQTKKGAGGQSYLHYLGGPTSTTRQRSDFDDYARGKGSQAGPLPFWVGQGAALLDLNGVAESDQVERLAKGCHPTTGKSLVKGSGDEHVMGLDMTFSAPKDVSAVFAGADAATRSSIAECVREAAKAALGYAEQNTVTRHGRKGKIKQLAQATVAAAYSHFSNRVGEPQLHIHGFLFNVAKRARSNEWSATEQRAQFESKMATGILFRVELAARIKALGFHVDAAGPYFTIMGITQEQRDALSSRSKQIKDYLRECGAVVTGAARDIAALNTRSAKAEPSLPELLKRFEKMAADIGLTPSTVAAMRSAEPAAAQQELSEPFSIDHEELLTELTQSQSCVTSRDALALICQRAMGRWNAAECLAELDRFLAMESVVTLGETEQLATVFTSKATLDLEERISAAVGAGANDRSHRLAPAALDASFDRLEAELSAKLSVAVSLDQQRVAARHIACDTGNHAFLEGWAGAGKTTMLNALREAYESAGFELIGCCQSAAASHNLARETGVKSRTIASLLLAVAKGQARLSSKSILIIDEAGMVGSREFGLLQQAVLSTGGKLVAVGDPKQLQPIDAGGIFKALIERHGKAEISNIQRQRTDFEPLFHWLLERGALAREKAGALRSIPKDARTKALESLCAVDPKLARAFSRWKARFDFQWLREAIELFATGDAKAALDMLDERGRLKLVSGHTATLDAMVMDWAADKTPLDRKTMIAGARIEVAELNAKARALLVEKGRIQDEAGLDIEIIHRDDTKEVKRFAPGDRVVFTKNDKTLGVANGRAGTIQSIEQAAFTALLRIELDDANELGERIVMVPPSFARFDHGYCLTNHKGQGRTFDSAYALANPSMCDRQWTYVAASRSRFATTIYANLGALRSMDIESHDEQEERHGDRQTAIEALAARMRRSRAKGTTLDYGDAPATDSMKDEARRATARRRLTPATVSATLLLSARAAKRFLRDLASSKTRRPSREPGKDLTR